MRGGRILVVGATGRVGGATVRHLLGTGFDVRALVRSAERGRRLLSSGAKLIVGDVTESETLGPALAGCAGVFCALSADTEREAEEVEYRGNVNLLSAARRAGVSQPATNSPVPTPPPSTRLTVASRGSGAGG